MTETKETLRKVISIERTGTVGSFDVNGIIIDFVPDVMIVRQISFYQDAKQTGAFSVYAPFCDATLGTFIDPSSSCPMTIIKLGKQVQQSLNFKTFKAGHAQNPVTDATSALNGDLIIILEFIKYNDTSKKVGIEAF